LAKGHPESHTKGIFIAPQMLKFNKLRLFIDAICQIIKIRGNKKRQTIGNSKIFLCSEERDT
jgi:hypothetical protein